MSYSKTTWVGDTTPLSPGNMNKIEQGIYDAHTLVDNVSANHGQIQPATGTGTAIVIALQNVAAYTDKYTFTFIASANNSGAATTINVNSLGAKPLYKPNTTTAPTLIAGKAYTVWYDSAGDCFFIKASATGTATPAQVLANVPYSNETDTDLLGEMPNIGSVGTQNLTTEGQEYTIPAGYHNGLGKVKAVITGLIASVIKAGVTVGGILGTFTSDANAIANKILTGYSGYVNGVKINGSMANNAGDNTCLASSISGTTLKLRAKSGYTDGVDDNVTITDADFIPANIKLDKNVLGLLGTYDAKRYATGTSVSDANGYVTVTGLAFQPKTVLLKRTTSDDHEWTVTYNYNNVTSGIKCLVRNHTDSVVQASVTINSDGFVINEGYSWAGNHDWIAFE